MTNLNPKLIDRGKKKPRKKLSAKLFRFVTEDSLAIHRKRWFAEIAKWEARPMTMLNVIGGQKPLRGWRTPHALTNTWVLIALLHDCEDAQRPTSSVA